MIPTAVVGVGQTHHKSRRRDVSFGGLVREAVFRALDDAEMTMSDIDAVVLSHAHLDHSGWLPGLVKAGFRGPILCSPATRDLAEVMLLDSAHLQEEDARRANRRGFSRHEKALPLYTRRDAQRAIAAMRPLPPGRGHALGDVQLQLTPVGHLLGACAVSLTRDGQTLAFSGDVGRDADLLMPPPQPLARADVLIVESTYGDRVHPSGDPGAALAPIVREATLAANPKISEILAPVFASLTRETLQDLNAQIQVEGLPARTVAQDYLRSKGFLAK